MIRQLRRLYALAGLVALFVLSRIPQTIPYAELEKRPAMQSDSLTTTNRYPVADTAKFFDGDSALSVLRSSNNAFADVVVNPSGKAPFLAGKFFQAATAGLRAFCLQLLAQATMAEADVINGFGTVGLAIAVNGNVIDTERVYNRQLRIRSS